MALRFSSAELFATPCVMTYSKAKGAKSMKRIIPLLAALLMLAACGQAAAPPTPSPVTDEPGAAAYEIGPQDEAYTYSAAFMDLTIPDYLAPVVAIGCGIPGFDENGSSWTFYYAPPEYGDAGAVICSIVEVPRDQAFDRNRFYNRLMTTVQVVAADSASLYVMVGPIGGVSVDSEKLDEYLAVSKAMDGEFFSRSIVPDEPDALPYLTSADMLTAAAELEAQGDATMNWAEAMVWAYDLISAPNKDNDYRLRHGAYALTPAAKAIAYLDSYGMLYGYEAGSLPPEAPFTRADFVQLLQRMQLARPQITVYPNYYGEPVKADDIDASHWACDALTCAYRDGWIEMTGGKIRPDEPITAAEMAHALRAAQAAL